MDNDLAKAEPLVVDAEAKRALEAIARVLRIESERLARIAEMMQMLGTALLDCYLPVVDATCVSDGFLYERFWFPSKLAYQSEHRF